MTPLSDRVASLELAVAALGARVYATRMDLYSEDQPRDDHGRFGSGGEDKNRAIPGLGMPARPAGGWPDERGLVKGGNVKEVDKPAEVSHVAASARLIGERPTDDGKGRVTVHEMTGPRGGKQYRVDSYHPDNMYGSKYPGSTQWVKTKDQAMLAGNAHHAGDAQGQSPGTRYEPLRPTYTGAKNNPLSGGIGHLGDNVVRDNASREHNDMPDFSSPPYGG